jgi:hypothetical protein
MLSLGRKAPALDKSPPTAPMQSTYVIMSGLAEPCTPHRRRATMTGVYSIVFLVLLFTLTTRSSAPPLKFPRPFSEDHLDTRYLQSSTPDYTTEAFECGETNYPIPSGGPKKMGDSIRICVQPNRITRERGVVMRGINNFTFNSAEITQKAVLNGGLEGGNTIISCVAGEDLCVFRTILDDFHFFEDGTVTGTGEIFLEYVTAEVARQTNPGWQQNLRRAQWTSDILFAGTWLVELTFEVEKGDLDLPEGKETFSDWWGGKSLLARNAFFAISTLFFDLHRIMYRILLLSHDQV